MEREGCGGSKGEMVYHLEHERETDGDSNVNANVDRGHALICLLALGIMNEG